MKTRRCTVELEAYAPTGTQWHCQRRKVEFISDQAIRIPAIARDYQFVGCDGEYAVFRRPNPNGLRVKIRLTHLDGLYQAAM